MAINLLPKDAATTAEPRHNLPRLQHV